MQNPSENKGAYLGIDIPISSANTDGTGFMLCESVKFTAKNGIAIISTANSNLDGTGTVADLISGSSSGTLIKRIIIKAQGNTTQGMVRIFFKASGSYWLLREVEIPAITQSSQDQTLIEISDEQFYLKPSYTLSVSTEKAETFIVTAEGLDMSYPS